ncbi:MAG: sigma-54 dependent transcriptional regulator [Sulfurimicrobium sp.]|nr:sigma-54 dependent transcriptional regulator [Sulfurimicrobium sp.]MDP1705368.1 sigma-54 dependent transcriptional regulator [Sulfurimicrobium sp.]
MKTLPILIVEDDRDLREALCDTLALSGYEAISAADGVIALEMLRRRTVGLVVTDVQMQPMDGYTLLLEIKQAYPHVPVLLMTAYGMIDKAVEAMRAGACHYLTKPFEPDTLLAEVVRYMLPAPADGAVEMIAEDVRSRELFALAQRVAATVATVMITGESGTGKEVVARFIHRFSPHADGPFVAINCAAIPENLLEATLFGYEKGAFTGAQQSQSGKFEQAQGGTLLLDEVSEMPLALQAKLLRVLQEREVERVGGRKAIPLDVRVLATSNRDLAAEVKRGRFREDLYYRLNVFPLEMPALRERLADIVPLARQFISRFSAGFGRAGISLSEGAARQLTQYGWPGNIRELENVIQRALILAPGDLIEAEHLHLPQPERKEPPPSGIELVTEPPLDMKSLERAHIMEALAAVKGSRKLAAQRLGMSERTLRYKLQQYREEGAASGQAGCD